jgi:hypothetical protein
VPRPTALRRRREVQHRDAYVGLDLDPEVALAHLVVLRHGELLLGAALAPEAIEHGKRELQPPLVRRQ